MPELSRFLGIIVTMYHREHGIAHFMLSMENIAQSFPSPIYDCLRDACPNVFSHWY